MLWVIPVLLVLAAILVLGGGWMTARNIAKAAEGKAYLIRPHKSGNLTMELYPAGLETVTIKMPDGSERDILLQEGTTFNFLYPPGGWWPPRFMRKTVRAIIVAAGNAEPWRPFSEDPAHTDEQIARIRKSAALHAVMRKGEAFFADTAARFGMKPIVLYILFGILILLGIIGIVFGAMSWSSSENVAQGFGLK